MIIIKFLKDYTLEFYRKPYSMDYTKGIPEYRYEAKLDQTMSVDHAFKGPFGYNLIRYNTNHLLPQVVYSVPEDVFEISEE